MRKALSVLLCMIFVLTVLPMGALSVAAEDEPESVVLNVKDFGAVGDGKTDDEAAIWATLECALMDYMVKDIPVTVYFPEGRYGLLNGGLYFYLPRGAGNLTIKGDGADKSTIVYLEEWTNSGSWVALRIYPRITPTSIDEYLHDITIEDLGIYDTDPVKHAWHTDKGDPGTEETHGFNIQYCVRATIKNCKVSNVGDEALDMTHCVDSQMIDNYVENSPGAGSAGGAISAGDGCENVLIANNTIIGSINDSNKTNWAIAVEALTERVEHVVIRNNTIRDIAGWGVNLGAPNGSMADIVVRDNDIYHCRDGGIRLSGKGVTTNIQLLNNYIGNVRLGVHLDGSNKIGTLIDGGVMEDLSSYAVNVGSTGHCDTVVQNVTIRNAKWRVVYNAGQNTKLDRLYIDGVGTSGDVTDSAIIQYAGGGDSAIYNSVILNCQNKRGIQGVSKVVNTYIQQPEISGYTAMTGVALIQNCRVNRMITLKSGYTVDGLVLYTEADLGSHAIVLSNLTDCTIKNCILTMPSRYGISEAGTSNNNIITNNVCIGGSGIKTVGDDTVVSGNVCSTLMTGEQFTYRVVDGTATVMAPVDPALTELEIPAAIDGAPVVAIDPWAFALCGDLASVALPDTLTTVGGYAFYGCDALTTVLYGGLEPQREALILGDENTVLATADWTYHWNNHTYDNACDPDCNDCPVTREVGEHVYDHACDAACNECGFLREVPDHAYEAVVTAPDCVNGGYTTYTCAVCGDSYIDDETEALGHAYDNACDADCNTCGDLRQVPDHAYDDDADTTCNECGFVRVVVTLGDVDGNGKINNRDLGLLQLYLNDGDLTDKAFVLAACDLDGNGRINNRDLGLLQKQLNQ